MGEAWEYCINLTRDTTYNQNPPTLLPQTIIGPFAELFAFDGKSLGLKWWLITKHLKVTTLYDNLWFQVLGVIRSNYDTLTLKLQDNLDHYEKYSEKPKEAAFFTQLVSIHYLVINARLNFYMNLFQTNKPKKLLTPTLNEMNYSNFQLGFKGNQDLIGFALLRFVIAPENSRHPLNQSNATWSHTFSRAWDSFFFFHLISHWFLSVFMSSAFEGLFFVPSVDLKRTKKLDIHR